MSVCVVCVCGGVVCVCVSVKSMFYALFTDDNTQNKIH